MPNYPRAIDLHTEEEILRVRESLPKLKAGDPLQAYKWQLSCRLRAIRKAKAGHLALALVRELVSAAGSHCPECREFMGAGAKRTPSLDHILPLSRGGTNHPSNLRVICNRCNSRKGDRA